MNILFENISGNTFKLIKETEFYHITEKDNMDSFIKNGIDITKSGTKYSGAGKEQGEGFYVYKNKNNADLKDRIKSTKNSVIVVIDASFNPENFDIDYEWELELFKNFINNNTDEIIKRIKEKFNKSCNTDMESGCIRTSKIPPYYQDIRLPINNPNGKNKIKHLVLDVEFIRNELDDIQSIGQANAYRNWVLLLQQYIPQLFDKFEKENLEKAEILKYNGNDKIYPIRIEDVNGNILWKK